MPASIHTAVAPTESTTPNVRNRLAGIGIPAAAAVAASLADAVIAVVARAAGASSDFGPLQPPAFISLTVVGILAGAGGWALIRRRARRPRALLTRLVPVVLGLSFIPDLAMLVSAYKPHSNAAGVFGLLAMHIAVATIAVFAYQRAMPVADPSS